MKSDYNITYFALEELRILMGAAEHIIFHL